MVVISTVPEGMQDTQPAFDLQIGTRDEFGQLFNSLGLLAHGAEIGVQAGNFSKVIRSTWKGRFLHLIDRWRHDDQYLDMANVSDREQRGLYLSVVQRFADDDSVVVYKLDSQSAAKQFPDGFFDWLYLDADHSYLGCKADLVAWYPKLKAGGILAGHDFVDGTFFGGQYGVKSAVEEFVQDREIHLYLTEENWKSWYFAKPDGTLGLQSCQDEGCECGQGMLSPRPDGHTPAPHEHLAQPFTSQSSLKLRLYTLIWRTVWWLGRLRGGRAKTAIRTARAE